MQKPSWAALACLLLFGPINPAHAAGVAICIAYERNPTRLSTDIEYFLRYGGGPDVDGRDVNRAARQDSREKYGNRTPHCRNSGRELLAGGYYVVVKSGRTKDYAGAALNRWGFGYGSSPDAAVRDALEHLRTRDWSWTQQHGYSVEDQGTF